MTDIPMQDYMWLVTPSSRRLHHAPVSMFDREDLEEGELVVGVTLTCGRRVGWVTLPGVLTRMHEPRCSVCCRKTGLPQGVGSPKNSPECRRILGDGLMTDVVITLAISKDNLLTSNSRRHWADKARRTKAIRDMAWILCKHEHRHTKLAAADLMVESRWPTRRVRDASSIAPMVKAAVDGIVDAGLLVDDNAEILRSEKYVIGDVVTDQPWVACWLKFTFTEVS